MWETHNSPRIRLACLNAIIQMYCTHGSGHPYKTVLKLLVSCSPAFELGSKMNRWSLVEGLEKIANKTFWYGIFQDEAYVKGISNQLWHLMNTISAFDGRLRKKLYVLYRRLFGYKQPAVWGMRAPHLQIIQSNKVNKRSLSKMNWKKGNGNYPKGWGTVPGQMVIRLKKISKKRKNEGNGGGDDIDDWTTVGGTRFVGDINVVERDENSKMLLMNQSNGGSSSLKKRKIDNGDGMDLDAMDEDDWDDEEDGGGDGVGGGDGGGGQGVEDDNMNLDELDEDDEDEWE